RPMKTAIVIGLVLAMAACERRDADTKQPADTPADNTKKNERDREPTVTPFDQGNNTVDLGITQKIRQGVVMDETLSASAKNVKIITVDGVVTLRGPVKSEVEKNHIASMAIQVAGVKRVDNQLEVAAN